MEWCHNSEHTDPNAIMVDLSVNKETYTAFDGANVWGAIYKDNCMID